MSNIAIRITFFDGYKYLLKEKKKFTIAEIDLEWKKNKRWKRNAYDCPDMPTFEYGRNWYFSSHL